MNQKIFLPVAIGTIIISSVLQSNLSVFRQYGNVSQKEGQPLSKHNVCAEGTPIAESNKEKIC